MANPQKTPSSNSFSDSQIPEEVREDAKSQVELVGDAATDPQPLLDEENDPVAKEVKESSNSDRS